MVKFLVVGAVSLAAAAVLAFTAPLSATTYEVDFDDDGIVMSSQGLAFWDAYNNASSCASGSGFTPLYDAAYLGSPDAFDAGMMIEVGAATFVDPDSLGTLDGNVLKTGATATVDTLKVNATARAIQTSPTLQYLVKFRNPGASRVDAAVTVSTDLGSDATTQILADSSGDASHNNADRWLVTADSTTAPFGDPIVTQVFKGRNAPASTTLTDPLDNGTECLAVEYSVRVPADGTKYLLLFAQLHDDSGAGKKAAKKDATKFDAQKSMAGLLKGVSPKIYSKVVNWNLKK